MSETYKVIPLFLGEQLNVILPGAYYYKRYAGENYDAAFGCFAVKSNRTGEVILVDSGVPSQEWMRENGYPFAFERMDGAPDLPTVMAEQGIDPLAVKKIIYTHLHQDHCFYMDLFPNAAMYVQKAEMQHAATPTEVERYSYQKLGLPGTPFWARAFHQLVFLEGDSKIQDGIEVMLTPGHTPGSQTIIVQTEKEPCLLVGDTFYTMDQYENGFMLGNFTDLEGWYQSRRRIMEYVDAHGGEIVLSSQPGAYKKIYG